MAIARREIYLREVIKILNSAWPENRTVNIVFHGHSVPSGYTATPFVDTFNSYPHLLHATLKARFPFAVINTIVTGIGGENSEQGAKRFASEVLCHRPDIVTIDYGLNDRQIGLARAKKAWETMIGLSLSSKAKVLLLTPSFTLESKGDAEGNALLDHANQIRDLAGEYGVGLSDSYDAFSNKIKTTPLENLMAWSNHPNREGHQLIVDALFPWFPPVVE
jgi:lysophospholipase L1-like esterase